MRISDWSSDVCSSDLNEHHIGTARIIFVKDQRDRMLKRPGKKAYLELCYLLSVFQDDGVPADQIDTAVMRIEIDSVAWPVKACRQLFDMRGLAAGAIAIHPDVAHMQPEGLMEGKE